LIFFVKKKIFKKISKSLYGMYMRLTWLRYKLVKEGHNSIFAILTHKYEQRVLSCDLNIQLDIS